MLVQPKFNFKYGHNCRRYQGPRLWNGVDNELIWEQTLMNGPLNVDAIAVIRVF